MLLPASFTTTGADVIHNTANDVTYKLTINRMTGMFTGFFTAPDGSKPVSYIEFNLMKCKYILEGCHLPPIKEALADYAVNNPLRFLQCAEFAQHEGKTVYQQLLHTLKKHAA